MKYVETVEGKKVPRKEAKLIGGKYYTPTVSCFEIKGKFYRIDSPHIAYDYSSDTYMLKEDLNFYGVVGFRDNNAPIFGHFSIHNGEYINVSEDNHTYKNYPLLSSNLVKSGWIEDLATGVFYDKKKAPTTAGTKRKINYNFGLEYGANNNNKLFTTIKKYFADNKIAIGKIAQTLGEYISDYTFGIEYESTNGTIPEKMVYRLGLVPLRDGSIKGYEYTTIPLQGKKGIQTIISTCKELEKRCEYNHSCSMHIHIGNVRTDKLFLVALYHFARFIQDEIYDLVPEYKKDPVGIAKLSKNYCQPLRPLKFRDLDKIDLEELGQRKYEELILSNYDVLYKFLAGGNEGVVPMAPGTTRDHPQGREKWHRANRYYWLNLIPAVFDYQTIEFRLHQGTFNADKVIGWLFLNIAILDYVDRNINKVLKMDKKSKITLNQIVEDFTRNDTWLRNKMLSYVKNRKDAMKNLIAIDDLMGKEEVSNDALPVTNGFLGKGVSAYEKVLMDSLMIFGNKPFKQIKQDKTWKSNLTNSVVDTEVTMIEESGINLD